jgi:predicted phage terminase large subunit-like protein
VPALDYSKLDPAALIRDRRIRADIKDSFDAWCRFVLSFRGQTPALHQQLFIRELQNVADGRTLNLIISAPQGSAKTTYASHLFAAWWIARNARNVGDRTALVLACAHTSDFAQRRIGRAVRDLIQEYKWYLDVDVDPETSAMHDWNLLDLDGKKLTGANYKAVGVGAALFGFRADCLIIEDPCPDWVTGQSKLEQDKIFEWYTGTVTPRLKPNAPRIIIATRLSENDLIGRILERDEKLGIPWVNIRLPMCAEENDPLGRQFGQRLWPEWYTDSMEREARADSMKWIGAWQQRPSAITGSYFRAEWFYEVAKLPPLYELAIYGASDFATSSKTSADWTVHMVVGIDRYKKLWLIDMWRMKTAPNEWAHSLADFILKYRPRRWAFEKGAIANSVGPFLKDILQERSAVTSFEMFASTTDKETRARSIQGKLSVGWDPIHETMEKNAIGGLRCPVTYWYPDFRAEMLAFPSGKHDDIPDTMGLIGQLIDRFSPPVVVPFERPPNKIISTDPRTCTVTLEDLFDANVPSKRSNPRIL